MDLKQLRERGAFVPAAPVAQEVSWTHLDGSGETVTDTFTVHVVKHSAGSIERMRAELSAHPSREWGLLVLSESLRLGDDASERLTYEDVCALEPDLARQLVDAVNAVNGNGRYAGKN